MPIDIRERGSDGERERNKDVREKHRLVASHMNPDWGSNPCPFSLQDDNPTN